MANYDVFNPMVQTVEPPNWERNVGRPISQPEADKSKGILFSTVGEGIEGTAKVAENTMEDYLKDKVRAGVEANRDTTTLAYQEIRKAQQEGRQPDPNAVRTAGFNGAGPPSDVPEGLSAGLDKVTQLGLAKSQGKANDTLYTGALNSMAKQLRAQYPGHRDFIDEQISRISGINPANAYMQNLLVDINKAGTGQDQFQKMVLQKAELNMGDDEVHHWLIASHANVPGAFDKLSEAVYQAEKRKAEAEQWKLDNQKKLAKQEDNSYQGEQRYRMRAAGIVDEVMSPVLEVPGITEPSTLRKLVQGSMDGTGPKLTPEQTEMLLPALQAAKTRALDKIDRAAVDEGYGTAINNTEKQKAVRDWAVNYFDRSIDAITSEKYGTLGEYQRRIKLANDRTNYQVMSSDIGEWARQRKVFGDYLGPAWNDRLDSMGLNAGKLQQLENFSKDVRYQATVPEDLRTKSGVKSLEDALDKAKAAKDGGAKAPDAVYDDVVHNIDLINTPTKNAHDNEVKKNVVDFMFNPNKNANVVKFFGRDYTDEEGKYHKGRFAMWDVLMSPKVIDNIWNMQDKESWEKTKTWAESSYKTLFGEEAKNLTAIQGDKSMPFKLRYDSDSHRFDIDFGTKPHTSVDANYQAYARRSIEALNGSLQPLAHMYRLEKGNVNEKLFDILTTLGYQPDYNLQGALPQKALDAIAAAHTPPKTVEEAAKKSSSKSDNTPGQ